MSLVSSMNPPWVIQKYFVQDEGEARPISAHMMARGTVVLVTNPVVEQLRQTAISLVRSSPKLTPRRLTQARYAAATKLEDAIDIDPIFSFPERPRYSAVNGAGIDMTFVGHVGLL